ncbi:MAG: type II secretion system major pseudopilin GspG [Methylacidiphilales bacterium]|nr:type II secretion system major pseudopilin GspG [Candidatus Methylacidiphilales bacterium]MDW8348887.1 type II secretion system major pseudopilin GspG [Verrucomicrobiae bacterium]
MKICRAKKAFTLLEIMIVVGIIAIFAAFAINQIAGNVDIAREQRAESDIKTISTQLRTYEMLNLTLPTTQQGLEALVSRPGGEPQPRKWRQLMTEIPVDPWGEKYVYRYPGTKNTNSFDLFSKGPDRQEGTADDIGNWKQ